MPDFSRFHCDRCGACCSRLIVEANYYDGLREPLLFAISPQTPQELRSEDRSIVLMDDTGRCPFLQFVGERSQCSIYSTRPMCCVQVEAGDYKCQLARESAGLPILNDRDGKPPTAMELAASAVEYGHDDVDEVPYYGAVVERGEGGA